MSKASRLKGKYYPIRRPKERERDLLKELQERERREEEKEMETNSIRKAIEWKIG